MLTHVALRRRRFAWLAAPAAGRIRGLGRREPAALQHTPNETHGPTTRIALGPQSQAASITSSTDPPCQTRIIAAASR